MKELLEKILGQIKKTPEGVRAYEDLYHICLETQKTDIPLSVEYLKKLSDIIENRIPQSETDKELRSLFMLHKKVLLAAAPFDFESYLLYVEWEREPDKKFYVPRREVMHPVVQAMQDLIDDRLDLLTISMPPGTGKSTLGIFFLSWVMGRFPDSQSLASAHSGMLTRSFYDGVYQIITDSEYLWADVFPGVKMAATNSKEETIDLHKKHRFSTLTCRAKQINTLNEYMFAEDKAAQDQELVEWQMICGTAFRLVLPDEPGEEDEAPFELYTLDPRDTFVVYSNEIGNKPLMAVKYSKDDNEIFHYSIYTENRYYLVDGDILVESKPHALDMIPIIEYPGNNARLGSFEIVLPLLDAINNVESNRMDGMEQLVQAFIKFINCDITKEEYEEFLQLGAIKVKSVDGQAADVGVVTTELNSRPFLWL